jgi:hypothetical protein
MAFEAFLTQDKAKPTLKRRLLITASLAVHGALLLGGVVYSFWHVEELSPPTVTVTFLANAPPPPPPPAAKKKRSEETKHVVREVVQPKPNEIVQPKEKQRDETDDGVKGGVDNGVAGGVVGGVGDGPPQPAAPEPPPPPKPEPPKFVPPAMGAQQLLINPHVPPYKLVLPPAFAATPGLRLWAMLQICVNVTGGVANVSIIKGMDPKVDGLLASKVRTWRYKPMSADGKPIPFCYRLRYEHQT